MRYSGASVRIGLSVAVLVLVSCFAPSRKSADPRVAAVAAEYRSRLPQVVVEMSLPHRLVRSREGAAPVRPPDLSEEMVVVFTPLAYELDPRDARAGVLRLEKTTESGTRLSLAFDIGSRAHPSVTALFFVDLGHSYESFYVPVSSETSDFLQYPIRSTGEWRRILENLAVIVRYLERDLVPRLESVATP